MNVKEFNLMLGAKKTRFLVQHEPPDCKCGSTKSVCSSKQEWNRDECRCKRKEIDDWRSYMWNCECNKACKMDKYLVTKIVYVKSVYLVN